MISNEQERVEARMRRSGLVQDWKRAPFTGGQLRGALHRFVARKSLVVKFVYLSQFRNEAINVWSVFRWVNTYPSFGKLLDMVRV